MSRRGNHEGSIYRREDGRFEGKVRIGGRRRSFYGKTEKEVRQQIRRALADHERGARPLSGNVTVEAFLTRWLEEVVQLTKEERTHEVYAYHVRAHLLPTLGRIRLDRLEPDQIQRLYARLQQSGLASKTVRNVHGVLSSALTQAVEWRIVGQNVASLTKPPRATRRKGVRTLSPAEVRRLWVAANPRWKTLLLVTALTGARQGEILGLQWSDVDFARGTLTIQRQLQRSKRLKEPKADSRRTIDLTETERDVLAEHQRRQRELRDTVGPTWEDHDLIFCTDLGRPLGYRVVFREYKKFLQRAGLPDISFHDLRHSNATILAAAGVPLKVIQERLGHADIKTTLEFYEHVTPAMGKDAARKLEDLLGDDGAE